MGLNALFFFINHVFSQEFTTFFSSDYCASFHSSIWSASWASLSFGLMVNIQLFKTLVTEWQGRLYLRESHPSMEGATIATGSCGRGERLDSTLNTTRKSGNLRPRSREGVSG